MNYPLPKVIKSSSPNIFNKAVALCADHNYLPYATFVANQIIEKEKNRDFDIVICIPEGTKVPDTINQEIRFCTIDYSSLPTLPVGRLSIATYYKLFLPALFSKEYEQILYLDSDVYIVNSEISSLLAAYQNNLPIVMGVDISEIERRSGLTLHNQYLQQYKRINHTYRNAGVILFNTKSLIEIDYIEKLFCTNTLASIKLTKHDQTLINTTLNDYIGSLSFLNNYQLIDSTTLLINDFKPNILHFVGELKPWNTEVGFVGSFHNEYQAFMDQYFPKNLLQAKSEFELKLESRKRKKKYKNYIRESISVEVFIRKEKLKNMLYFLRKSEVLQMFKNNKIRTSLIKFKKSIQHSLEECDLELTINK